MVPRDMIAVPWAINRRSNLTPDRRPICGPNDNRGFQIDKRLGDEADFDALIKAAHDRGLRIMLDGVFNHVGREHPLFQRTLADGPHLSEAAWFRLTRPADSSLGEEPAYATFEGHRQLV